MEDATSTHGHQDRMVDGRVVEGVRLGMLLFAGAAVAMGLLALSALLQSGRMGGFPAIAAVFAAGAAVLGWLHFSEKFRAVRAAESSYRFNPQIGRLIADMAVVAYRVRHKGTSVILGVITKHGYGPRHRWYMTLPDGEELSVMCAPATRVEAAAVLEGYAIGSWAQWGIENTHLGAEDLAGLSDMSQVKEKLETAGVRVPRQYPQIITATD